MATSSKFNQSSSTPDRPSYTSGQRGSYTAGSMERLGGSRESLENPVLSSLPTMSRSGSSVTQADVMSFFQCLRFDPKSLVAEFKSNRHVDYKRHVGVAMGISPDNSPSSQKGKLPPSPSNDELKRVKAALRENSIKARERIKLFNEGLSVLNKFLPMKKRSRSDVYSNERSTAFLSGDRPVQSSNLSKMAHQSPTPTSAFELEQQHLEERTKASVPNKRTRTSMVDLRMDGRSNSMVRASGAVDRLANASAIQEEDRSLLPVRGDGWEKSKMKKKRSVIKPDISSSALPAKSVDGYRGPKQGLQQKSSSEARSRLQGDPIALRSGISNGAVGKSDGVSQHSGLTMQSSASRSDLDNNSALSDKKDRPSSEKERLNMKALNKTNIRRNDFSSASPLSNSKMNASIRAPRSGSGAAPKLSPVVHRATTPNDWELSPCTTKPGTGVGPYNRKRTASTRSSSPPVANWAGQRPQKISRSARRTNFGPIVSNNDDTPILDTVSELAGNEAGSSSARRLSGTSPQVKLKVDPFSYTDSEDSDIKLREKGNKVTDEMDEKSVQNVQKVSALMLSSRKNKLVCSEEREVVRRQGRTGRGFTNTRSLSPMAEKVGNVGNAKQLRSAKPSFDNVESKTGRRPTRKLSDRKAYSRQRQATTAVAEFLGDGHGELLAAAHAVISSMHAFPNKFWQQMEPLFGYISDVDLKNFKQQEKCDFNATIPNPVNLGANYFGTESNGIGSDGYEKDIDLFTETSVGEFSPEQLLMSADENGIPLCQRLMAALISEDDYADICSYGKEDTISDVLCSPYEIDGEVESNGLNHHSPTDSEILKSAALNDHVISVMTNYREPRSSGMNILNTGLNSDFCYSANGLPSDQVSLPSISCSESEYSMMNINEKLLLEIQSIGIYPDISPVSEKTEDGGISEDICTLEKLLRESSGKKVMLQKVLRSAMETREIQEKDFEQRSLDKLVEMAYLKYMSCHRANASGSRSTSNKAAKKAALAFAKWTLDQCHKFEFTGKSCFNEPSYREVFLAGCSRHNAGPKSTGTTAEGESVKQYSSNAKLSALQSPPLTPQLPENVDCYDANSADMPLPVSYSSDQSTPKEDTWSSRFKKRELLLDDVAGSTGRTHLGGASGVGGSMVSSAKGKRSDRDREGTGQGREGLLRNGTAKNGRQLSTAKGERKSKAKLKQKTTQLSVSGNSRLGNEPDQLKPTASNSNKMTGNNNISKEKTDFGLDQLEDPLDFSQLQLPDMDDQGQDLGSWLNSIDDDNLQDQDFMGLEIPMDDLTDLNMLY